MPIRPITALACLCALWLPLAAGADTLQVGPGKAFPFLAAALARAKPGDTIAIAAGDFADCATVTVPNITISGAGMDKTFLTGKSCAGKAILVTQAADLVVSDITLRHARVPDHNGAGIRGEGTGLLVLRVHFDDNENGILTNQLTDATLTVRDSLFTRNGTCEYACGHGIYAGHIGHLIVEKSSFYEQREGHHIKSRAHDTLVTGCDIGDGDKGTASYTIDIPNGGKVVIRDNRMEKGPLTGNTSTAIAIGEEGVNNDTPSILVENNRLIQDGPYSTSLVWNKTDTPAVLKNNRIMGAVSMLRGPGTVQ